MGLSESESESAGTRIWNPRPAIISTTDSEPARAGWNLLETVPSLRLVPKLPRLTEFTEFNSPGRAEPAD